MGSSKTWPALLSILVLLSLGLSVVSLFTVLREEPQAETVQEPRDSAPAAGGTIAGETLGDEVAVLREQLRWMNERVHRLEGGREPRPGKGGAAGSEEQPEVQEEGKPLTVDGENIAVFLQDGGYEPFLEYFGKPDKQTERSDGSRWLHYYKKGIKAHVDYYGKVLEIQFFGEARSDNRVATGRWVGVYDPDGKWYRPCRYFIDGVSAGMHVVEVFRNWGAPDKRNHRADGTELMVYESRNLALVVDENYRVIEMEFSKK
ncbi:MAG: hypothetical protein ACYS47_16480 [Planctomycetota bacterium]|jgi:hypothetical protein